MPIEPPIAIARGGVAAAANRPGGIRRILLGTDLSATSDGASSQALDLAHDLGAELLVVSVIDPKNGRTSDRPGGRVDQLRADRELTAQEIVTRGRESGVRVTFLIWQGDPGEAIVDAAKSEAVDLVVVGSHGRGSMGRLLIGSVSDHVVRHAPCPVLVVRGPQPAVPH
ncbi:MAG TPA: universal stress protein [Candidatus Limnocylindrales bacterium]|nr:universal stress protein [Candidatus Limnocylindrales bacterium]